MTFRVYCPSCRTPFDVDESLAGEKGLCPSCQTSFRISWPTDSRLHALAPAPAESPPPPATTVPFLRGQLTVAALGLCGYLASVFTLFRFLPRDEGFKAPEWVPVLGNFHPLILHLPIGLILGAVVLDALSGKARRHAGAVTALLWISFLTAAPAAISGYLSGHDSDSETLRWHMWSGLAIPFLAGLTLFTKLLHESKPTMATGIYRAPLFLSAASLFIAGHFGGSLTHGDVITPALDLLRKEKNPFVSTTPADPSEKTVYEAAIAPLMAKTCTGCHGEQKQKGDLQLHTLEVMLKAGESGMTSFVPGKPDESESLKRILLPKDHEDHMPPEEKTQLSDDEVAVLKWWVEAGAKGDLKVKDSGLNDPLKTTLTSVITALASAPAPQAAPAPAPAPQAQAAAPAGPDPAVAALEKELGVTILPLAQNDPGLTFNCVNVADKFGDAELAKFAPIAERLAELNLARSKVTDAGLASLAGMKNLRKLHLQNTAISDAGVDAIAAVPGLEYLNLFNTKVTDAALPKLEKLANLKKLYVWQTGVTKPAAEALHQKLPAITINLGWDNEVKTAQAPPPPPPAPTANPEPKPIDPEAPLYAGLIQPIFERTCTGCHGADKQKGKLAMHNFEVLMKGGDSGEAVVVAGKSADSLIIKRIALPAAEDEHMPPEDKPQPSEKEIKILKWWIDGGAKTDVKIKDAGLPDDLK
jgi:mono/diheme cytochrome c family protein/uncharacterized membrane protein